MADLDIADCINGTCPWSGEPVRADSLTEYNGKVVGFCNTRAAATNSTQRSATSREQRPKPSPSG